MRFALVFSIVALLAPSLSQANGLTAQWPNPNASLQNGTMTITPYHFVSYLHMVIWNQEPDVRMLAQVNQLVLSDGEAQRKALFKSFLEDNAYSGASPTFKSGAENFARIYRWLLNRHPALGTTPAGEYPAQVELMGQNGSADWMDRYWDWFNRVLYSAEFRATQCTGTYAYGGPLKTGTKTLGDFTASNARVVRQTITVTPPPNHIRYESRLQPIRYRPPGTEQPTGLLGLFRTKLSGTTSVRTFPVFSSDSSNFSPMTLRGPLGGNTLAPRLYPGAELNVLDADVRKIHGSCPDRYVVAVEIDRFAPAVHSSMVTSETPFPHNPWTYTPPRVLVQGCDLHNRSEACQMAGSSVSASSPVVYSSPHGNFIALTSVNDGVTPFMDGSLDDGNEYTYSSVMAVAAFYDPFSRLSIFNLPNFGLAPKRHIPFSLAHEPAGQVNNIGIGGISIEEKNGSLNYFTVSNRSDYYRCYWQPGNAAGYANLTNLWSIHVTMSPTGFGAYDQQAIRHVANGPSGGYCSIQYPAAAPTTADAQTAELAIYAVETPERATYVGGVLQEETRQNYVRFVLKPL